MTNQSTDSHWTPDSIPVKMVHLISGLLLIGKAYYECGNFVIDRPLMFSQSEGQDGKLTALFHDVRPFCAENSTKSISIDKAQTICSPYEPEAQIVELYHAAWNAKTKVKEDLPEGSKVVAKQHEVSAADSPFVKR